MTPQTSDNKKTDLSSELSKKLLFYQIGKNGTKSHDFEIHIGYSNHNQIVKFVYGKNYHQKYIELCYSKTILWNWHTLMNITSCNFQFLGKFLH